jgi:hypothetical protein
MSLEVNLSFWTCRMASVMRPEYERRLLPADES